MKVALTCLLLLVVQFGFSEDIKPDAVVMIPMRDGLELPTDLYLPHPEAKGLPCILIRSPAGRNALWKYFAATAKLGYVIAIQDTRSSIDKEGKTLPFMSDGWGQFGGLQDGYDTVEWLAKSPYTNGEIGTWGSSATGITQLMMAPSNPPHLKCQYIMFAAASLYHDVAFPGGQFHKNQVEVWLGHYAWDSGVLGFFSQRPFYNNTWANLDTHTVCEKVNIPALHYGGWFDTFLQGTLTSFKSRQEMGGEGARGNQKLVVGPWTHFWPFNKSLGDFQVPEAGYKPPIDISEARWFDHYLKGNDNGIDKIPAVTYYVMGPFDGSPSSGNVWKTADSWPVPATQTNYYLSSKGALGTSYAEEGVLSYEYDPENPVPTLGGRNLFLESGPKDQRPIESRDDLLVFTSEPLAKDLEVTGNIHAKVFLRSNQADTDVVVRLSDVYPDGRSILIQDGGCRLCVMHPESANKETVEVTIDLSSTSIVFAKGHRIRVSISSSNYPRFEKNVNMGVLGTHSGEHNKAHNTILFGEKTATRIVLPIVE